MFETVLNVEESPAEIVLQKEDVDTDGMNYLAGKTVDFVNKECHERNNPLRIQTAVCRTLW